METAVRGVGRTLIFLSDRLIARWGARFDRRQNASLCTAKTDSYRPRAFAPGAKDNAVAVLQKLAKFAAADRYRPAAARAQFQQGAGLCRGGSRLSAGPEQIAGAQIAPVDRVVRDQLRNRPVGMTVARQ